MTEDLNAEGIPATKTDYLEKIQELYLGKQFFLALQNIQGRPDYYHQSVDPDGFRRNALEEEQKWKLNNCKRVSFFQPAISKNEPALNFMDGKLKTKMMESILEPDLAPKLK